MAKSQVLFVRGLPGSGKSTFARHLVEHHGYVHIESDEFFTFNSSYKFRPEFLEEAHNTCRARLRLLLLVEEPRICVANTFVKSWHLRSYRKICEAFEASEALVELHHNYGSIHEVPEGTFKRMSSEWESIHDIEHIDEQKFYPRVTP